MIGEAIFGVAIYAGCQKAVDTFPVLRNFFLGNTIKEAAELGASISTTKLSNDIANAVAEGYKTATGAAPQPKTKVVDAS